MNTLLICLCLVPVYFAWMYIIRKLSKCVIRSHKSKYRHYTHQKVQEQKYKQRSTKQKALHRKLKIEQNKPN